MRRLGRESSSVESKNKYSLPQFTGVLDTLNSQSWCGKPVGMLS